MTNQELLNKAQREYIDLGEYVKKICKETKNEEKTHEVLVSLDIMLQLMLMYLSVSNLNTPDSEINFIKLLTVEKDVVDIYNEYNHTNLTWEDLKEENMDSQLLKEFIDRTYLLYKKDLDLFISFLASADSKTEEDYLTYITKKLRNILIIFTNINNETDERFIDFIINEVFAKKYRSIKEVFNAINISF